MEKCRLLISAFALLASAAVSAHAFDIIQIDPEAEAIAAEAAAQTPENPEGMPFGGDAAAPPESFELSEPPPPQEPQEAQEPPPPQEPQEAQETPPPQEQVQKPEPPRRPTTQAELRRMSREELFMLAFGRTAAERPRNLVLNLYAEGRALGTAEVVYSADFSSFEFISPALSGYLDTLLTPETRLSAGDSTGYFDSRVLEAAGFRLWADELSYVLSVTVPPEGKTVSKLNLMGGRAARAPRGDPVEPAFVSFYANYTISNSARYSRMNYDFFGNTYSNETFYRAPAMLSASGAFTMFRWVLAGSMSLIEPAEGQTLTWNNWRRGGITLSRDITSWNSRVVFGDIGMAMGGGAVGGVRFEHSGGLFGGDPQADESRIEFFMPRSGMVQVYMDGVYRYQFFLPAGHHEVWGFGGEQGRNSVRLVLSMEDGSIDEIPFEYVLGHWRNVARGKSRYTLTAGIRRETAPSPACFEYIAEEPAVSLDYMYGLTRALSVGMAGIATNYNNVGRAQMSLSLGPVGWMSMSGGGNYIPGEEERLGSRLDVGFTPNIRGGIRRVNRAFGSVDGGPIPNFGLSLRGYYQSAEYNPAPFSSVVPNNPNMGGVSGSLGFGLWRGSLSATANAQFMRETEINADNYHFMNYSYGARTSQRIMRLPVSASAGVNVVNGVSTPYFSVNMSHGFGVGAGLGTNIGKHRLSASANIGTGMGYTPLVLRPISLPDDVRDDPDYDGPLYEVVPDTRVGIGMGGSAQFEWSWASGGNGVGARSYSASMTASDIFNPHIPGVRGNFRHTLNRGQLSGSYRLMRGSASGWGSQTHNLNATYAGSFMFADGLWAFGRPVSGGGFVLAEAFHSLKGSNVHVDRSHTTEQDLSRNGWLGAAYRTNVSAYNPTEFRITLTDAPIGGMLPNNRFYTTGAGPSQGYALRLGAKEGVLLQAAFVGNGRPLSYAYLTIEPEGGKESDRRATFTGNDGTIQMSGLKPGGTYRIRFARALNMKDVVITIPKNAGLIYEAPVSEVASALTD